MQVQEVKGANSCAAVESWVSDMKARWSVAHYCIEKHRICKGRKLLVCKIVELEVFEV